MTLAFVYIKKYRNLNEINFNLGGRFSFNFDAKHNKLSIEINTNFIDNFFVLENEDNPEMPRINLISAIVGENGVGKTSFLDCLKDSITFGGQPSFEGIIIFEDAQKNIIYVFTSDQVSIKNQNKLKHIGKYAIRFHKYATYLFSYSWDTKESFHPNNNLQDITKTISLVFLSNIFDKREEIELHGMFNLSTNFLVRNDFTLKYENNEIPAGIDIISEHKRNELKRELDFINAFKSEYKSIINFKLPDRILLNLINAEQLLLQVNHEYFTKTIITLRNVYNNKNNKLDSYQHFIYNFFLAGLTNIIWELYKYKLNDQLFLFRENKITINYSLLDQPILLINDLLDQFIVNVNQSPQIVFRYEALKETILFLDKYYNSLSKSETNVIFSFLLRNQEDEKLFFEFYDLYRKTYIFDSYITFDWRNLSTGQKALLNIYARLYSISPNEEHNHLNELQENIIILIDEGELYLHPRWQKELLFQLLKTIPHIFKSKSNKSISKNIQIILTSNSPLIISDIPSSNIVFLKNRFMPDGTFEVLSDSLTDHNQTFAANIHSLLADSFFMENGLIGDFAYHRINEVITILQGSRKNIEENKERITKTILMIGEPVIKEKLIQMLNERLSLDMIDLNQRISTLENEIETLKKKR